MTEEISQRELRNDNADGDFVLSRPKRRVVELAGALRSEGPRVTVEAMNDAIASGASESAG